MLPDWRSFTTNCLGGDKKAISAAYTLLVEGLRATCPELMNSVKVIIQSESIISNPSDYWISVINVGRKFALSRVLSVDEENQQVSLVISALMHVGDVMGTSAAHIVCQQSEKALHELAVDYYKLADISSLPIPEIHLVPAVQARLRVPTIDDLDVDIFPLLDTQADVNRKMKKAFCEPSNVDYNPPLVLTEEIAFKFVGELVIKRKPEYGGDKIYTNITEIRGDFAKGELHPGDLKPPVGKVVDEWLGKVREQQKKEAAKKALADVKNFLKKKNKK